MYYMYIYIHIHIYIYILYINIYISTYIYLYIALSTVTKLELKLEHSSNLPNLQSKAYFPLGETFRAKIVSHICKVRTKTFYAFPDRKRSRENY